MVGGMRQKGQTLGRKVGHDVLLYSWEVYIEALEALP